VNTVSQSVASDAVFRAVGLTKIYASGPGPITVFSSLDFEVRRGESLAIVGESGAGKSSLLYLLGGLDAPTSGALYFGDQNIATLRDASLAGFRNREIGFVWQNHSLLPEFTALENVMMPLLIRGQSRQAAEAAAMARLEEVGLKARVTHRVGELSGGEQQRVAIARALSSDPSVLLADEPTGNLDYRTGEAIIELLLGVQKRRPLTAIFVTHNLAFASRCTRVLELREGTLVPWAPAGPLIENPVSPSYGGSYV
jgi:lipoprotein-releasing system ATP-binding protein